MMKRILFAALAATMLFASCSKQDNNTDEATETTALTIKIAQATQTKTADKPGEVGLLNLREIVNADGDTVYDGMIYIIDTKGDVVHNEELKLTSTDFIGQQIEGLWPATSRVYVVANFPSDIIKANLTTLKRIQEAASYLSANQEAELYKTAALANDTGEPAKVTVVEKGKGRADITLKPLMSRMELHSIKGGESMTTDNKPVVITSFDVTGVYVDSYDNAFTLSGAPAGIRHEQYQSEDFAQIRLDELCDEGPWNSITETLSLPSGDVWAYQVTACQLPRFFIGITNIHYTVDNTPQAPITEQKYVTVSGYNGITAFERGKIYRVGGEAGLTFTLDDLGDTPNPTNLGLTVYVTVEDWVLVDAHPIL